MKFSYNAKTQQKINKISVDSFGELKFGLLN